MYVRGFIRPQNPDGIRVKRLTVSLPVVPCLQKAARGPEAFAAQLGLQLLPQRGSLPALAAGAGQGQGPKVAMEGGRGRSS